MDSRLVDKLAIQHRNKIRKGQLEGFFKQRRQMLERIDEPQAASLLDSNFKALKLIVMNDFRQENYITPFIQLKKIAQCCNVVDQFCQIATFTPQQARAKELPEIMTWLDLLLLLLRDSRHFSTFYEVTTTIVQILTFNLKDKVSIQLNGDAYIQQMERVLKFYPYQFLKEDSALLVGNTLQTISAILTSSKSSEYAYYLVNKTSPPLLKMINQAFAKKVLMLIEDVSDRYVQLGITMVYFLRKYNFEHLQPERYEALCKNLRELGTIYINKNHSKDQFRKACVYLNFLTKLQLCSPTLQDCQKLEDALDRQIGQESLSYFQLLTLFLNKTLYRLASVSFKKIVDYIFDPRHQEIDDHWDLRIQMLKIIKLHIINCGNQLRDEDLNVFNGILDYDIYPIIDFAQELHERTRESLEILLEIIGYIIDVSPDPLYLVSQRFFSLLRYSHYRTLITEKGFTCICEDEEGCTSEDDYIE